MIVTEAVGGRRKAERANEDTRQGKAVNDDDESTKRTHILVHPPFLLKIYSIVHFIGHDNSNNRRQTKGQDNHKVMKENKYPQRAPTYRPSSLYLKTEYSLLTQGEQQLSEISKHSIGEQRFQMML